MPEDKVDATPAPGEEKAEEGKGSTGSASDAWIGGIIWVAVIVFFVVRAFYTAGADVSMNVAAPSPLQINGRVSYDGTLVKSGAVQIVVEQRDDHKHVSSAEAEVANGKYTVELPRVDASKGELRVIAHFVGVDAANSARKGETTRYLNGPPPWNFSILGAAILIPLLLLVFLFTGPLPPGKARLLFGITYIATFGACIVPIVLTIAASNPRVQAEMETTPVGIIRAKTSHLPDAQWLVNIGGSVVKTRDTSGAPAPTPAPKPAPTPPANPAPPSAPAEPKPAGEAKSAEPKAPESKPVEPPAVVAKAEEPNWIYEVKGGLSIPLYVLILAMFGAAINMTRTVPAIQKDFDGEAVTTLNTALAFPVRGITYPRVEPKTRKKDYWQIRQAIIETYMYFLAAPFLAVAVYYLLQIVANSVAEPVLVVISFASGLMTNATVEAILAFADSQLKRLKEPPKPDAPVPTRAASGPGPAAKEPKPEPEKAKAAAAAEQQKP